MGVDTPQSAVMAVLKKHVKWQKQLKKRQCTGDGESEYRDALPFCTPFQYSFMVAFLYDNC